MEHIVSDPAGQGPAYLDFIMFDGMNRFSLFIKESETKTYGGISIGFNTGNNNNDLNIISKGDSLFAIATTDVTYLRMVKNETGTLPLDTLVPFEVKVLYTAGKTQMVLSEKLDHAMTQFVSNTGSNSANYPDAVQMEVSSGSESRVVDVLGRGGSVCTPASVANHGLTVDLYYGSIHYEVPFSIKLVDFQLERYPGSNSPASYASEVVLLDKGNNIEKPYRIFMNHVLNYRGYRFFQSSYDPDEKGTIFSVNHDAWGTLITYIGYILMALGMILSIFNKRSRLHKILSESSKVRKQRIGTALMALFFISLTPGLSAATADSALANPVNKEFAKKVGSTILVQDQAGRLKPFSSITSEVLRKISRKTEFKGLTSDQVFLEMMLNPTGWQSVPMIKVTHDGLKETIGMTGKYASFNQLVDFTQKDNVYKIGDLVQKAYAKQPSERGKFEKDVIAVDERVNICYMIYTGSFLRIFPIPGHANQSWAGLSELDRKSVV